MVAIPVLLLAGVFEYDRRHNTPWVSDWFHDWAGVDPVERRAGPDLGRGAADADDRLRLSGEGDAVPQGPQAVTLTVRYFAWLRERVGAPSRDGRDRRRDRGRAGRRAARPRRALRARLRRPRARCGSRSTRSWPISRAPLAGRARGGVLPADDRGLMAVRVQREDFDLGAELAALRAGRTRHRRAGQLHRPGARPPGGDARGMELEHYPGMTEKALAGDRGRGAARAGRCRRA